MSSPKWTKLLKSGVAPPIAKDLENMAEGLDEGLSSIRSIYTVVKGLATAIGTFVASVTDLGAVAIKQYSILFKRVLSNIGSLGGQTIIIHPFNRFSPRDTVLLQSGGEDNSEGVYSVKVPAMTPAEAVRELESAFNNSSDPLRPTWGLDTRAAGFAILIASDVPEGLINTMEAWSQFIDLKEFKDLPEGYASALTRYAFDLFNQGREVESDRISSVVNNSAITFKRSTRLYKGREVPQYTPSFQEGLLSSYAEGLGTGTARWAGISLYNLQPLAWVIETLSELADDIANLADTTSQGGINALITTLLARVDYLMELVETIVYLVNNVLQSLRTTNVFYLGIPAGEGGTSYILDALKTSLNQPVGDDSTSLAAIKNTANFSAIFFAGAAVTASTENWSEMFDSIWTTFDEELKASGEALQDSLSYWLELDSVGENEIKNKSTEYSILPSDLIEGSLHATGSEKILKIVSDDSSLVYSYSLRADSIEVSSFATQGSNQARANVSQFPIKLSEEGNYTLSVKVWSTTDASYSSTRSVNFSVSSDITEAVSPNNTDGLVNIDIAAGFAGSVSTGPAGRGDQEIQYLYMTEDGTVLVGDSFGLFSGDLTITLFNESTGTSITFTTYMDNRYDTLLFTNLPNTIYVDDYSAYLNFDFEGVAKMRVKGDTEWFYVPFPTVMLAQRDEVYEYSFYISGNTWTAIKTLTIEKESRGFGNIC